MAFISPGTRKVKKGERAHFSADVGQGLLTAGKIGQKMENYIRAVAGGTKIYHMAEQDRKKRPKAEKPSQKDPRPRPPAVVLLPRKGVAGGKSKR